MSSAMRLLKQSLLFYKANASLMAGYVAWMLLPYAALVLIQFIPDPTTVEIGTVICEIIEMALYIWIGVLLTIATRDLLIGKPVDPGAWREQVRVTLFPIVLVSLLQTVVILGGFLLFLIPGIVFSVWFFFAPTAAILDGKRGMEALSYSRSLVRGRFWLAAWNQATGPLVFYVVYYLILALVVGIIASLTNTGLDLIASDTPPLWFDVLATISDTFAMPVTIIYITMLYLEFKNTAVPAPVEKE